MKTISKTNKKAYKQIKNIINSTNMVDVENQINSALLDVFGLRNLGLIKCAMQGGVIYKNGLLQGYGANTYGDNFELLKAMRNFNLEKYHLEVKKYLISFIPKRMHACTMYYNLINSLN